MRLPPPAATPPPARIWKPAWPRCSGSGLSRAAKDFACRTLTVIGTAASVPALAALLADAELSHMARYALERIPAPEAAAALRDALPKLSGKLKIGVIGSLGVRRDEASVPALAALLGRLRCGRRRRGGQCPGRHRQSAAAAGLLCAASRRPRPRSSPPWPMPRLAAAERLLADGNSRRAGNIYRRCWPAIHPNTSAWRPRGTLRVAGQKG